MKQQATYVSVTHCLTIFAIIFANGIVIVSGMPLYGTANGTLDKNIKETQQICNNEDCIALSKHLKNLIDFTVDPCEDFYKFTCGNFMKLNIPSTLASFSIFTSLKNVVVKKIRESLETPVNDSSDPLFVRNAKTLYSICQNTEAREKNGLKFLENLLERLNGWPVVKGNAWESDKFDWIDTLKKFAKEGINSNYLFDLSISINLQNSTQKMIEISGANTILDGRLMDENFKNKTTVIAYHKLMMEVAVLLGAEEQQADEELWDVVLFEAAVAKSKFLGKNSKEFLWWTLAELNKKCSAIPWNNFINNLFVNSSANISDNEPISIVNENFLLNVNKLMSSVPRRVLANYLIWRAILSLITELPSKFHKLYMEFQNDGSNIENNSSLKWLQCITSVSELYSFALSYLYVKNYFDNEAKALAREIVKDIKEEMTESLLWLDDRSHQEALKKLKIMEAYVGYPDELMNVTEVGAYYGNHVINPSDDFLESFLRTKAFLEQSTIKTLRTPLDKKDWKRHSEVTDVNAFYSVVDNSIYLPAAVLQGTFFGKSRPHYMNYGGIGFVIGHEMTHAYDIQGSLFDFDGNMRDWWSASSKKQYLQRAACVHKQFDSYEVKQVNKTIDGKRTASENMADSGGLKVAYSAYFKKQITDPFVIGFENYTSRQMFWISAACIWCTIYRDEALNNLINTGVHSPGEYRVNGALANQKSFAEDFNCPLGSPMNPKEKCSVWDL